MRTALQDADIRNVLANTFTPYDLVKALLLPSRPPEKPQLPRIGEILALCGIEVPELAGQRGELALPPEIWCHTFGFLRDRKNMTNIRLVCSTWKALIGRQIWGTLITDFAPTEKQDLEALLSPGSGILPYVRRLIICKVPSLFREDLEVALRRFLECMPRKSLKVFLSLSAMSPKIFKDLIAWHPKLERFEAFIEPEENEFTQYEWIAQRLSEVRTYQMWIKRKKEEDSLEFHRKLMTAMLRLQDLEVYYEPRRVYQASAKLYLDISPAFVNGTYFPRLSILTLMGVDMRTCTSPLLERFELYKLRKLYLLDCSFSSVFITSLSSWYDENPGLLDTFHFRYPCHLSDPAAMILRASLEQFITVCPSLSRLIIEYRGHDALPVSCITKHGETLQSLRMGMDAWPDRHDTIKLYTPTCSARDLETMLRACKKLEGVGLDMPFDAVDLGSVSDAEPSFELARQATDEMYALPQFEHFLSIIGRHPRIQTLRILNLPRMHFKSRSPMHPLLQGRDDTQNDAEGCQRVFKRFADEVFNFLASFKSAVHFIEFRPTLRPAKHAKWDGTGHQWPDYSYTVAKTSSNGPFVAHSKPAKMHYSAKAFQNA